MKKSLSPVKAIRTKEYSVLKLLRQDYGEGCQAIGTFYVHRTAVKVDYSLDDGESDAVTLGGVGLIALIELVEDVFLLFRRDGRTRVGNIKYR